MPAVRAWFGGRERLAVTAAVLVCAAAVHADESRAAGWTRTDLHAVTQPAPVAGLFVLYVSAGGGLEIVGLDAATGTTVWSHPASTSSIAPGVAPALEVAGERVIYLGQREDGSVALTAADARTGAPIWQSEAGAFTAPPSACADDRSAVCLSGQLVSGPRAGPLRFDAASGRPLAAAQVGGIASRELGEGLFDPADRHPEKLVLARGARVTWSRPLGRIFSLRGATTDYGWNFGRIDRLGVFVGSVSTAPARRGGHLIFDLSHRQVVAFRISDGGVRWRAPGQYTCDASLPCPGESQVGYTTPQTDLAPTVGLRLVERGTWSFPADAPDANGTVSSNANVLIEGFAPARARALWRFDAGREPGLIDGRLTPALVSAHTVVIRDARRRMVALDLASGARRPVSSTVRGWCRPLITYQQSLGYEVPEGTIHRYFGQRALVPCNSRSQRGVPAPSRAPAFVGDIGARGAGLVAWTEVSGVVATPVK